MSDRHALLCRLEDAVLHSDGRRDRGQALCHRAQGRELRSRRLCGARRPLWNGNLTTWINQHQRKGDEERR